MAWLDISVPIRHGMPVYEGDPGVHLRRHASLAEGAICNLTAADLGLHSGTHVDAPNHFLDGAAGVEAWTAEHLLGPAQVVDARSVEGHITPAALDGLAIPPGTRRVLFQTRNGSLWERAEAAKDFVALTPGAAEVLVARGVVLAGIDYLSIAPFSDPAPTHEILLGAGIAVLEGLDLRAAPGGPCELVCLPVLIPGADGAPARVFIRPLA
jgi:arylformamidase